MFGSVAENNSVASAWTAAEGRLAEAIDAGIRVANAMSDTVGESLAETAVTPRDASDAEPATTASTASPAASRDCDALTSLLAEICTTARGHLERLLALEGDVPARWIGLGDAGLEHAADAQTTLCRLATVIEQGREIAAGRSRTNRGKPK